MIARVWLALPMALLVAACSHHDARLVDGDMGGAPADAAALLAIAPGSITLGPGHTQLFQANLPVRWSVVESGGGQIDDTGLYSAPATLGSYHVRADSTDDSRQSASATVHVEEHRLSLLAGALGGSGDADDSGGDARFANPQQMAYDGAGALYVADADNHTVRKLAVASGAATTVAGLPGVAGSSDGVGAAARFKRPWGLALDGKGGLFVSDSENHTIRRIDLATRAVSTVSGVAGQAGYTEGQSARYTLPLGLTIDGAGLVYVADSGNGAVRQLDPSSGSVRSLAQGFSKPIGLATDGSSYVYVADGSQERIARIALASGTVDTLAGGGLRGYRDGVGASAHFTFLGQLALAGNTLYVADLALRALDLGSNTVTTLAAAAGGVPGGGGLALDGQGHLFVSLVDSHAVARTDLAGGARSIVAGPPLFPLDYADGVGAAARFDRPRSLAWDPGGTLYVSDMFNGVVRSVEVASGTVKSVAGSPWLVDSDGSGAAARFNAPERLASDGSGVLFVVEPSNHVVRRFVTATGALTTIAGRWHHPGAADGSVGVAQLYAPGGVCASGGNLYIADSGNDTIRALSGGVVSTLAGSVETPDAVDATGASARFDAPRDLACDGAGFAYVADANNHAIRRIDLSTGAVVTVAGALRMGGDVDAVGTAARFTYPSFLALAGGNLYVAEPTTASVRRVRLSDFDVKTLASHLSGSIAITGIAADASGNVYLGDRDARVRKLASDGTVSVLAGDGSGGIHDGVGTAAGFNQPSGLVLDGASLYLAEPNAATLRRLDLASATVSTVAGCGGYCTQLAGAGRDAFFLRPYGLALDGTGGLFITDLPGHTLDRLTLATATLAVAAGAPLEPGTVDGSGAAARLDAPSAAVWDGLGTLYLSDDVDHTIRRLVAATGELVTIAGQAGAAGNNDGAATSARFHGPEGLALDGAGGLYIADAGNHVVRKLLLASGEVSTVAGLAGSSGASDGVGAAARFDQPLDIAFDGHGNLYVADAGNGAIRRIELATATVTTWAGLPGHRGVLAGALPARLNRPHGLVMMADGALALIDEQAVLIIR